MVEMIVPMMGSIGPADFGASSSSGCDLSSGRFSLAVRNLDSNTAIARGAKDLATYVTEFGTNNIEEQRIISYWMKIQKGVTVRNKLTGREEVVDTIVSPEGEIFQNATDEHEKDGLVWQTTHRAAALIAGMEDGGVAVWASPREEISQSKGKNNRIYRAERRGDKVLMTAYTLGGSEKELRNTMERLTGKTLDRKEPLLSFIGLFEREDKKVSHEDIFAAYTESLDHSNKGRLRDSIEKFREELKIPDEVRVKLVEERQREFREKFYQEMARDKTVTEAFGVLAQGVAKIAEVIEEHVERVSPQMMVDQSRSFRDQDEVLYKKRRRFLLKRRESLNGESSIRPITVGFAGRKDAWIDASGGRDLEKVIRPIVPAVLGVLVKFATESPARSNSIPQSIPTLDLANATFPRSVIDPSTSPAPSGAGRYGVLGHHVGPRWYTPRGIPYPTVADYTAKLPWPERLGSLHFENQVDTQKRATEKESDKSDTIHSDNTYYYSKSASVTLDDIAGSGVTRYEFQQLGTHDQMTSSDVIFGQGDFHRDLYPEISALFSPKIETRVNVGEMKEGGVVSHKERKRAVISDIQKSLEFIVNLDEEGRIASNEEIKVEEEIVSLGGEIINLLYSKGESGLLKRVEESNLARLNLLLEVYTDLNTSQSSRSLLSFLIYREIKWLSVERLGEDIPELVPIFSRFEELTQPGSIFAARSEELTKIADQIIAMFFDNESDLTKEDILDNFIYLCFLLFNLTINTESSSLSPQLSLGIENSSIFLRTNFLALSRQDFDDEPFGSEFRAELLSRIARNRSKNIGLYTFEKLLSSATLKKGQIYGRRKKREDKFPRQRVIYKHALLVNRGQFMTQYN